MHLQLSFSAEEPEDASPQKYRWELLFETIEIGPASLCSFMLWRYAGELDAPSNSGHVNNSSVFGHVFEHIRHPAPKLVLLSALGFGCCVSSFVYRRQGEDPFQVLVFALVVGTAATVAYGAGASPDLLLLGYMPFATCASMIISVVSHAVLRRARCQEGIMLESQEKVQLL